MNISDCLDSIQNGNGATNSKTLTANGLEETELIQSISKLLYKTKSARSAILIIDSLSESEYCIMHSNPKVVLLNNSEKSNEEILESLNTYRELPKDFMEVTMKSKHEQIPYSGC